MLGIYSINHMEPLTPLTLTVSTSEQFVSRITQLQAQTSQRKVLGSAALYLLQIYVSVQRLKPAQGQCGAYSLSIHVTYTHHTGLNASAAPKRAERQHGYLWKPRCRVYCVSTRFSVTRL